MYPFWFIQNIGFQILAWPARWQSVIIPWPACCNWDRSKMFLSVGEIDKLWTIFNRGNNEYIVLERLASNFEWNFSSSSLQLLQVYMVQNFLALSWCFKTFCTYLLYWAAESWFFPWNDVLCLWVTYYTIPPVKF